MRKLSDFPFAIRDADFDYSELIWKLGAATDSCVPVPFEFTDSKGVIRNDELRSIFPIFEILKRDPSLKASLLDWARSKVPVFLKALFDRVADDDLQCHGQDICLTLRARVVEDQPGFSLAPHADSRDTLFAFILQLSPNNPTTSGFVRDEVAIKFFRRTEISEAEFIELCTHCLTNVLGHQPVLTWTVNQFTGQLIAWEINGKCWVTSISGARGEMLGFSEVKLDVPFGSILGIHNPVDSSFLFNSPTARAIGLRSRHGVYPRVERKRKLLLLDLIGTHTKNDFLALDGMGTDPNSYFVSFRKDTTSAFLRGSGFIRD